MISLGADIFFVIQMFSLHSNDQFGSRYIFCDTNYQFGSRYIFCDTNVQFAFE